MTPYQEGLVLGNESLGDHVRHVTIQSKAPLPFFPGQFFLLRLKTPEGDYVERSYSAANFFNGSKIEFVIRIEPKGQMSRLIDRLLPSSLIDMKGPFGQFGRLSLSSKPIKKMILIAGGVGIAPFRSMLQYSLFHDENFPIQLFYGFRTPKDFLFQSEFEAFEKKLSLKTISAISESSSHDGWKGKRGFISEHLEGTLFAPEEDVHAFICGPPPMVKVSREKLLSLGFDRKHIHLEAW